MLHQSSYALDRDLIKIDLYRLICLFHANKEIARRSDPKYDYPDAAALLEIEFFSREMSRLLLSIAIGMRTLDDQMKKLDSKSPERMNYLAAQQHANNFNCMMFEHMSLREVCNKILHANVVEPHMVDGTEPHQFDHYAWEASLDVPAVEWKHLSGNIRLGGMKGKEQWWQLLEVPVFVEAVHAQLSQPDCKNES